MNAFLKGFLLWGLSGAALATPLQTIGTFCGLFPDQCMKGTTSLLAARGIGTNAYYVLEADPTTGSLPVNITGGSFTVAVASDGPTGAAVPAQASYVGLNNGGTLIGGVGDSSGRAIVAGGGTAGTPAGGILTVQGVTSMTPLLATGTGTAGTAATGVVTVQGIASGTVIPANVSQFGGSAIATGTGTGGSGIPRVTVSSDSTIGIVAGTAIIGKVAIDQTTPGTTNAVKSTNFPTTVDTDTGASGASTLRFVPATRSEAAATPLSVRQSNGTSFADYGSGALATTTLRVVVATDNPAGAGRAYADSVRYAYSSGAVSTVSWVQLIASTAAVINCVQLFDSSGQTLELGTGAGGAETRVLIIPPGGLDGCVPLKIAASTRIAIRALSATTGVIGEIDITGFN